jgi:hypothetical protein
MSRFVQQPSHAIFQPDRGAEGVEMKAERIDQMPVKVNDA